MKLSIIIPVYNVEDYLQECLDSVFDQENEDYEVICVNDGSTDGSLEILKKYSKIYNNLTIISQPNGGLSNARNTGLLKAKGDYVFFLDSDDFIIGSLKTLLDIALSKKLDIIGFNARKSTGDLYLNEDIYFSDKKYSGIGYIEQYFNNNNAFPGAPVWLYLFRRNFLLNNKLFFKEGIVSEDEHFTYRSLFYANDVSFVGIPIVNYRVLRVGAITESKKEKQLNDIIWIARDLFNFLENKKCKSKIIFYKIFKLYQSAIKKIIDAENYLNRSDIITKEDIKIMRLCIPNDKVYVHFWLYKHYFAGYRYYMSSDSNDRMKNIIAKILKVLYKDN